MAGYTRRDFLMLLGKGIAAGATYLMLSPLIDELYKLVVGKEEKSNKPVSLEDTVSAISELEQKAENHNSNALKIIDYAGSMNFGAGIYSLTKHNKIHPGHYTNAAIGLIAKYLLSDEAGKHHVIKELEEGRDALGVILSTTIAAEGVDLNLDKVTKKAFERTSTNEEKIFMAAILPLLTSSFTTTVGSSTMLREEVCGYEDPITKEYVHGIVDTIVNEERNKMMCEGLSCAEIDARLMKIRSGLYADLISHISNNSGFMFLGDPPFIAMLQKYGAEGFKYQNKIMLPMILYSASRLVVKLSKSFGAENKYSITDGFNLLKDSHNWELLAGILKESGYNVGRSIRDIFTAGSTQSDGGLRFSPLKKMQEKLHNTLKIFRNGNCGDNYDGSCDEVDRKIELIKEEIKERSCLVDLLKNMKTKPAKTAKEAIGLAYTTLKDSEWFDRFRKKVEHAYGENMTDILTIFPFQAASIPFLQTVLKDYLETLDHLPGEVKDAIFYLSIAAFSSLADNYVACKLGLKVYSDRPEIPLIASIIGGSCLPPGNMANMALVSTKKYSLKDGIKELKKHADMLGFGYAYSKAIPYLRDIPILGKLYENSGILEKLKHAA